MHDKLTNNNQIMYKYWHPSKQAAYRATWLPEMLRIYGPNNSMSYPEHTRTNGFGDSIYAQYGFPKGSFVEENTNNRNSPYYDKSKWG